MEDPFEAFTLEELVSLEEERNFAVDLLFANSADQACDLNLSLRKSLRQHVDFHIAGSDSSRGLSLLSSQSPESHSTEASTNLTEESIAQEGEVYNHEYQVQGRRDQFLPRRSSRIDF